mmetsp:Transcript_52873/g.123077  ORF Transcript_52873/g.123077 Transcript_52873/m.123077 type:complete len:242 (+) Transcript_52873:57-782(+)
MGADMSIDAQCRCPARSSPEGSPYEEAARSPHPCGRLPTLLGSADAAVWSGGKERLPVLGVEESGEDQVDEALPLSRPEELPKELEPALRCSTLDTECTGAGSLGSEPVAAADEDAEGAQRSDASGNKGSRKNQRKAERNEAKRQVRPYLERAGFKGVNSKRHSFWSTYPLHRAVRENDPELVRLLIKAGADPKKVDVLGRTPHQLAEGKDRAGSHAAVLAALGTKRREPSSSAASFTSQS